MKKKCELCNVPAIIFCEADQASLCWDCDAKVHAANFLVARHSRTLLCHHCRSPTPWKASGATLRNAVSLCHRCAAEEEMAESEGGEEDGVEVAGAYDDGDNQFVPWSSKPPPPPESSEESVSRCSDNGGDGDVSGPVTTTTTSLKRQREDNDDTDRDFQEDRANGSESQRRCGSEVVACDGEGVNGTESDGV